MKIKKDLWWVSVSGSPSHPTTLSASPTQLLVGQLTRLPFHSCYATVLTCHHRAGPEAYVVYRHASRALFRTAVSLFPVSWHLPTSKIIDRNCVGCWSVMSSPRASAEHLNTDRYRYWVVQLIYLCDGSSIYISMLW